MSTGIDELADGGPIFTGVRAFYAHWRDLMIQHDPATTPPPVFEDLPGEAVTDWLLAYAANIELTVWMARAARSTLGVPA